MFDKLKGIFAPDFEIAEAHCDAPCGVYDPAQARIEAESVLMLTKKILDLKRPEGDDETTHKAYANTLARFITIKEARADMAKHHLLVLWTDYFKPEHLTKYPDLHETFWKAAKLCSSCKQEVSLEHAQQLMEACKKVHQMFWDSKGKDVAYYTASY